MQAVRATDEVDLMGTYWLLSPLVRAWGRDDPEVGALLREGRGLGRSSGWPP